MFKVVLVDDNPIVLKEYLCIFEEIKRENDLELFFHSFRSGEAFFKSIRQNTYNLPNLLFLDITMQGMSGIQVAKKIRECKLQIPIIFLSGNEGYVFQVDDENVINSIIKNEVSKEGFKQMFLDYYTQYNEIRKRLQLKGEKGVFKDIEIKDIIYIEDEQAVVTVDGNYKLVERMEKIKSLFQIPQFLQTKRYIMNLAYIKKINEEQILMEDENILTIQRDECKHLKIAFAQYLSESLL